MSTAINATFRNGVFVPSEPCDLPNETEVRLVIEGRSTVIPPSVTDPQERAKIMAGLIERMRNNPIPANAPRFTREELHERR